MKKLLLVGVAAALIASIACLYTYFTDPVQVAKQKRLKEVETQLWQTDWTKHTHSEYAELDWERYQLNMPSGLFFVGLGSGFAAAMGLIFIANTYGLFRKLQKPA